MLGACWGGLDAEDANLVRGAPEPLRKRTNAGYPLAISVLKD